jgi:tetratricopeptide (TPR) repeat protein
LSTKIEGFRRELCGLAVRRPAGFGLALRSAAKSSAIALLVAGLAGGTMGACRKASSPEPLERGEALRQASEALAQGRADDAVEILRPVASQQALDFEVSLLYGRALVQNQQASLAIWPLERATAHPDAPPESRALLVRALAYGGGVEEAIREASLVLEEFPENANVRRLRADAYKSTHQMEAALRDFTQLVEQAPKDPRLLEAQIDLLTEMERYDEARLAIADLRALTQAADVEPEVAAHFCAAAARFEHDRGNSDLALEQLADCLERHPKDPTVILSRVDVLDGSGRDSEATEFLVEAARGTLSRFRVQYALATRLASLDRADEAEKVLLEAAKNVGGAQPLLALADQRVARRDLEGAAQAVVDAIRGELGKGPGDPDFDWKAIPAESLFAFGDVFISAEDYDRAKEIIEVLDEEAFSLLLEARLALATGDPKSSLELYERAFRLWPANSGARYLAGVAAMKLGEFDRSMSLYQDALRADAMANDAGIVLARMQLAQGFSGAAFDTLEVFLRKNKEHPQAIRDFATAAMRAGLFDYGEGARARLASDVQWAGVALADHARDLARARGAEEARRYLETSKDLFQPSHFEALWTWVETLDALGRFDEAAAKIEQLYAASPASPGFAIVWARVLLQTKQLDEAKSVLEPVVQAEPGLHAAQRDLGVVLLALGESEAAIDRFDHADRLDPLDAEAAYFACHAVEDAGRPDEARARLERFVSRHPWHAPALVDLARLRVAAGERDASTAVVARQALRFAGTASPASLAVLGGLLADLDAPQDAVEAYARAVVQGGASPAERYRYAKLLIGLDRRDPAKRELEALVAGPAFPELEAARATLAELAADENAAGGKSAKPTATGKEQS